jgi:hypothetical protein
LGSHRRMTKGDLNLNLAPLVNDGKVDKAEVDSMNDLWLQSAAESAKEEKARCAEPEPDACSQGGMSLK